MRIKKIVKSEVPNWEGLKIYAAEGELNKILDSGDRIPVTLKDGQEIELDVGRDENGKTYFIFRDCLKETHAMNHDLTNKGGWAATEMRRYANDEVFGLLPDDLQAVIKPTKIVQIVDGEKVETMDKLFCLSYTQVFGHSDYWSEQEPEDTQVDIFATKRDRVKMWNGESWFWWLRSANSATNFGIVNSYGISAGSSADYSHGVALGFCI